MIQKLKNIFLNIWFKVPSRYQKILKITAIVFAALIILMFILSLFLSVKKPSKQVKTMPSSAPQITGLPEVITNPSRYATDSAILKIGEDLKMIEKELEGLQINEVNLLPPRLDFNINFEK